VVEILEVVGPPPTLVVGEGGEGQAAPEEVEPLVAPTGDRDVGMSPAPEAVVHPPPQAGGSENEVLATPEVSFQL
jgi:hypothetical protein